MNKTNPGYKPFTLWLTGRAGAGKTTLARRLARSLRRRGYARVVILDCETPMMDLTPAETLNRAQQESLIRSLALTADLLTRTGSIVLVAADLANPEQGARLREKQRAPLIVLELRGDGRELDEFGRSETAFLRNLEASLPGVFSLARGSP